MLGQIIYCEKAGEVRRSMIGETAVLTVSVPKGKNLKACFRAHGAAGLFKEHRISLAAFPPDYPYVGLFAKRGITAADAALLYRENAAEIALCALHQMEKESEAASVLIISAKNDAAAFKAAETLARRVRYLMLRVPSGESFADRLRRQYGIAVQLNGKEKPYDIALLFDVEREKRVASCLDFADTNFDADYILPQNLRADGELTKEMLAALVCSREISADKLQVSAVRWRKTADSSYFPNRS